jgi:lipoteichoic acid synthase
MSKHSHFLKGCIILFKRISNRPVFVYVSVIFLKLFIIRYFLFNEFNIFNGFLYDMIGFLLLVLIALLLPVGKAFTLFLINLITSIFFFVLIVYVKYYQILPTYFDLFQVNQLGSVRENIFDLLKPQYFLIFIDVFLLLFLFLKTKIKVNGTIVSSVFLTLIIVMALQFSLHKNDRITDVLAMAKQNGIIHYEIIQFYQDQTVPALANTEEVSNDQIYSIKGIKKLKDGNAKYFGIGKSKNVIIIQLESFQDFLIDFKIEGKEITPTLNSLKKESFYFNDVYQQIGAGNTSDAEFLINTSLYPAGNKPSSKVYENKIIPSLPRVLSKNGYFSATFHADDVHYWNRINLYPSLGFDKYYEKSFFKDEDLIGIGPSDEVLYSKTLKELSALIEEHNNVYAHVLSLTSHTPFEIPNNKKRLYLPSKFDETKIGNYLVSVNYADYALGEFIIGMKEEKIWDNSIVVIYGDHSGYHPQDEDVKDKQLIADILGHPYDLADRFNIPLFIHVPGEGNIAEVDYFGGQIDIMPTVANLLGIELNNQIHFGQDLFNYNKNLLGMRYYLPAGSYLDGNSLYVNYEEAAKRKVINLKTKKILQDTTPYYREGSLSDEKKEKVLELLNLSDYYINSLPEKDEKSF